MSADKRGLLAEIVIRVHLHLVIILLHCSMCQVNEDVAFRLLRKYKWWERLLL